MKYKYNEIVEKLRDVVGSQYVYAGNIPMIVDIAEALGISDIKTPARKIYIKVLYVFETLHKLYPNEVEKFKFKAIPFFGSRGPERNVKHNCYAFLKKEIK